MEEREYNNVEGEKKTDWVEWGKKLWSKKVFILKVVGVGIVVGLIIAFSIPKEYTTKVVLVPDVQEGNSSMSSLASMAGINLGSTGQDALASPELYPDIFRSTPFLEGLLPLYVKDLRKQIDTTFYSYLNDFQSSPWWSYILKIPSDIRKLFVSKEQIIGEGNKRILSKEELDLIELLNKKIKISSDKKTSITTIEVKMQSPEISAFLADTLTSYFQHYIIEYRTQKARNDLAYSEKLYEEAKADYYKAQQALATYVDGNLNVVSAKYRTTQERLLNEANLAYSVYNQTAQQLQLGKVKVQDNTPVFTVIQPAIQPLEPSKPKKKIILIGFVFLAFVVATCWVLRQELKEMIIGSIR